MRMIDLELLHTPPNVTAPLILTVTIPKQRKSSKDRGNIFSINLLSVATPATFEPFFRKASGSGIACVGSLPENKNRNKFIIIKMKLKVALILILILIVSITMVREN